MKELHWLSFADEETGICHGVAIVEADGIVSAVKLTHELGINPGGQVMDCYFDRPVDIKNMNRLLSREEATELRKIYEAT